MSHYLGCLVSRRAQQLKHAQRLRIEHSHLLAVERHGREVIRHICAGCHRNADRRYIFRTQLSAADIDIFHKFLTADRHSSGVDPELIGKRVRKPVRHTAAAYKEHCRGALTVRVTNRLTYHIGKAVD